jgi:hypothetical protein
MEIEQCGSTCKPPPAQRDLLPNRRLNRTIKFEHEGHQYLATAGFYPDCIKLGEIFLHTPGMMGTPLQENADTAAILTSLLLQYGVDPEVIRHSITGPIAIALGALMEDAP